MKYLWIRCIVSLCVWVLIPDAYAGTKRLIVEMVPESISKDCRGGIANVYDECSDQTLILQDALARANRSGKSVLVVYGAEWCIWCHVFDQYVKGGFRKFEYKWQFHDGDNLQWKMIERESRNARQEAYDLNKYVSDNFVIAHVEGYHAPNGEEAMAQTGVDTSKLFFMPYIVVLDSKGKLAAEMQPSNAIEKLEVREDSGEEYRGYNRIILLAELKKLREAEIKANRKML